MVFRADASLQIGSGHVMRCLTLADAFADEGAQCHFLCRAHPGHLMEAIVAHGHVIHELPNAMASGADSNSKAPAHSAWLGCDWGIDARQSREVIQTLEPNWLVVDHYALDARWEQAVSSQSCRLLIIDDLADRPHAADLLLDQNLGRSSADYSALVPASCRCLIGPQYGLLRPEFARLREVSLDRRWSRRSLGQLLITLGGVDKDNAAGRVLSALKACDLPDDCRVSVIMGETAPWLASVRSQAANMPWPTEVVVNVADMAWRMANADLAIGAAGSTAWERCCLALPTFMLVLADNQRNIATNLDAAGAVVSFGTPDNLGEMVTHWTTLTQPDVLESMAYTAASITDGQGLARLIDIMACSTR